MTNFSRREFIKTSGISSIMLATATGEFLSSCNTSNWQIGAYTRAWGNRDYRIALDGMVEAGYKYVGLSTHDKGRVVDRNTSLDEAALIGEEIKSRGLTLITNSGGSFDLTQSIEEGIVQLKRLIDNSAICGSPVIQINNVSNPEHIDKFYKVISECCDYGIEKGVMISVKPHGSTGAECRKYVDRVGHKNFKLWYDPGNVYYYTEGKLDPVEDVKALENVVVGMAVKDFRLPKNINVTPGTGMVNFPDLLTNLQKNGFNDGPLVVECLDVGDLAYITAEAKKAREYLEKIII